MTQRSLELTAETGITFDAAVISEEALSWARQYNYELVTGLTDTTRKLVQQSVSTFVETPGMTRGDLEKLLAPAFGENRASMIGVTEVTRAYSEATNQHQRLIRDEVGLEMRRRWDTLRDELTCAVCGPLNGMPEENWVAEFPNGPPAHVNCRCSTSLTMDDADALRAEAIASQTAREKLLREQQGVEMPEQPPLRGFEGQARFGDIGRASGRAVHEGDVVFNRQHWQDASPELRRYFVSHEIGHQTVEPYVLKNNDEWNLAEEVLTLQKLKHPQLGEQRFFVGGNFAIGEGVADAFAMSIQESWPEIIDVAKAREITEWAQGATRRAGFSWELLGKDIKRIVKELDTQI